MLWYSTKKHENAAQKETWNPSNSSNKTVHFYGIPWKKITVFNAIQLLQ